MENPKDDAIYRAALLLTNVEEQALALKQILASGSLLKGYFARKWVEVDHVKMLQQAHRLVCAERDLQTMIQRLREYGVEQLKAGDPDKTDTLPPGFFRTLDGGEEAMFRKWARENFKRGDDINALWHPVVREECRKIERGE